MDRIAKQLAESWRRANTFPTGRELISMINSKREVKSLRVAIRQSNDRGQGGRGVDRGEKRKKEEAKEDKGHGGSTLDGGILPWGTKRKRKTGGRGPVVALNAATAFLHWSRSRAALPLVYFSMRNELLFSSQPIRSLHR